jgi:hypothetical protein
MMSPGEQGLVIVALLKLFAPGLAGIQQAGTNAFPEDPGASPRLMALGNQADGRAVPGAGGDGELFDGTQGDQRGAVARASFFPRLSSRNSSSLRFSSGWPCSTSANWGNV